MEVRTNGGFPPRGVVTGEMDDVIATGTGLRSPPENPGGGYQIRGCGEPVAPSREFADVKVIVCEPRVDDG